MENILNTSFNIHIKYSLNGSSVDRENKNDNWYFFNI